MHIGNVGPYTLQLADDSLPLSSDIRITEDPPMHHLSWVALPGLAFAMQVIVEGSPASDARWRELVTAVFAESAATYEATTVLDIDGTVGPGNVFRARRYPAPGRYENKQTIVEHYVGEAYNDVIDLTFRFHGEHVAQADSWRGLFLTIVYSAIVDRGSAMARAGKLPPATRKRA